MKKSRFLFLISLIISLFIFQTCPYAFAVSKKVVKPKIAMVTAPKTVYAAGEKITINVRCPNCSGNVQYRAILWNGQTKKQVELYSRLKGYYSSALSGTRVLTLSWVINDSGTYNITILAKRSGARVSYDSYVKTAVITVTPGNLTLNKEGTTFESSYIRTYKNANISASNITLKNVSINGTLTIDAGEKGTVTLTNVTASNIVILSLSENGIHFNNVKTKQLTVQNKFAGKTTGIILDSLSSIDKTSVLSNAVLDATNGSFGDIEFSPSEANRTLSLAGTFKDVEIDKPGNINIGDNSNITDCLKISAKTQVTSKATSNIEKIDIENEQLDDVSLTGSYKYVIVNKPVKLSIDAAITTLDINTDIDIVKTSSSVINNMNTNGHNVNITVKDNDTTGSTNKNTEPLKLVSAGLILSTDTLLPIYFSPSNTNEFYINLTGEKADTSVIKVCIKASKDCVLTFPDINAPGHILKANAEKLLTWHDINPNFVDNPPDGITIQTFRNFAIDGYVTVNIRLDDRTGSPLNIKLKMKVK